MTAFFAIPIVVCEGICTFTLIYLIANDPDEKYLKFGILALIDLASKAKGY